MIVSYTKPLRSSARFCSLTLPARIRWPPNKFDYKEPIGPNSIMTAETPLTQKPGPDVFKVYSTPASTWFAGMSISKRESLLISSRCSALVEESVTMQPQRTRLSVMAHGTGRLKRRRF
jgi:hypothetical protein